MASLDAYNRLIIKIGSSLLVDPKTGNLRSEWLHSLAGDIAERKSCMRDVLLVSSGSIALGRRVLGLSDGVLNLEESQAAAAVGQIRLAQAYETVLGPVGIKTAQILLTLDDSTNRRRYLNSRRTMTTLLDMGVVPIVNENDTVATDEIRYGDNDRLAAQVAAMVGGDLLILLSDVDGLYTADPKRDPSAKHIPFITQITSEMESVAGDAGTAHAKGGMKTKIIAAKTAMSAGCGMVIVEGDRLHPLRALNEGVKASWFKADQSPNAARKNWISGMKPRGKIQIDAGAVSALSSGKSLLSIGACACEGHFQRGDMIQITDISGQVLAFGLVNYDVAEVHLILGKHSHKIENILGYKGRGVLVHRDDMVM